ncbi:hypothetical protein EFT58_08875 [Lactococcus lactis]|uniref:hypothetical protein n=1 Tax=Lactococcus lactis TaxID=1358 RepID=UPI0021A94DD3|nr:hypothetical protein [Lactococcus lactis]MCT2920676.1 hypothetical protein [Lactococcus lactis]
MAYTLKQWKDGDVITKEALNNIEQGIVDVPAGPKGDKGDTGATGKGVKGIALTTTDGKVTGGTVTFDDDSTGAVTVTEA